MQHLSRRELGQRLLALLLCRAAVRGQQAGRETGDPATRVYRADAAILLLGVPIYRREGVGGGRASIEIGEGASRTLFFAAGSDPKRAQGLSRLGWMREVVVGPAAAPSEISYFGILTSSPEESLAHARRSAGEAGSGHSVFNAVNGRNTAGRSRSATARFEFPASASWSDTGLIREAQSAFAGKVDWRETWWPKSPEQAPPTFLSQLASLLAQPTRRRSGRYVYNEQEYLLELESQEGSREADRLLPVRGVIRNLRTKETTRFRVWLEDGSVLPVRIEFHPRSFLKLTFTAIGS
jgi:hypothetical protein